MLHLTAYLGITPAYAGKSRSSHICRHESQDHPRLCGEKQTFVSVCDFDHRITPAYAGKSHALKKFTELTGDHPRLCGEKTAGQWRYQIRPGSPPPMRGKGQADFWL